MFAPVRIAIRKPSGMGETLYQIVGRQRAEPLPERKPSWLQVRAPGAIDLSRVGAGPGGGHILRPCSRAAASKLTS